ncbi:MAG: ATP-binding protein [Hydrogenophaga sp.]|uniref:ATP-binding protein n=1 Tax=Hydrogenophaga sp. TaxID=1904254 RepID=UPI002718F2DB|nr:ATP-binding protein [Hydrogenophaga sp.]MDO9570060.1 ATP-binding protein [Hydrogenophaga sp.]MDP3375433.1 ATP-binding protein [Hydrogenophaga sp.]MDZ4290439.1 ATP-binding protein [Hydrogenophaga sp.]
MTAVKQKLPIGIQGFAKLREEGCYYVDKTPYAMRLIEEGSHYFLSRPRRFGKSLFLDTLKELFEGHAELFKGLAAETQWDWTKKYPVIRISFSDGVLQNRAELDRRIVDILRVNRLDLGLTLPADVAETDVISSLADLLRQAHRSTGQRAVVLIDEYDKPILDNITDTTAATAMREGLKNLYSVLKDADAHLKFVFLTGVSKFSKVSLFSGLNNLQDITLTPEYSALCGYTDADVDTVFAPELPGLDREHIRNWYNGYNWLGTSVYNPFDLLLLFRNRKFKPYWFETGTPTFLIQLLAERQFFTPNLSQVVAHEKLLSTFDVDNIPVEALMFQAGYLTIDSVWEIPGQMELTLKYPNLEVQASLNDSLLQHLSGGLAIPGPHISRLYRLLAARDFAGLKNLFHAFFASIPNDWYRKNQISQFEGYYASIFYSYFAALGLDIRLEDTTNHGRIDMAVLFNNEVLLFEFKVVELTPQGQALQQIKDKGYADKYRARGEPIHLIGVEFSRDSRNVVGFEVEALTPSSGQ